MDLSTTQDHEQITHVILNHHYFFFWYLDLRGDLSQF